MTIREIQTRAGSLSSYGGYIFLMFCWYFAFHRFESLGPQIPESPLVSLLHWGVRVLLAPLLLAGVYGCIYDEQQRAGEAWGSAGFLKNARSLYGRMLGANLLYLALGLTSTLAFSAIFFFAGTEPGEDMLWVGLLSIPFSALSLFLFAGVTVERRVWRGLFGSLRTLVRNPFALAIGLVWGLISFADNATVEFLGWTPSLALDAARAVVMAAARILAITYALSLYQPGPAIPANEAPASLPETAGMGWVRASFGLAFVSFLPLVHFAALALGVFAIQRSRRFTVKAAVAVCAGGFFTLYYVLLAAGWMAGGFGRPAAPPYTFLSEVTPQLGPQVALLEQGSSAQVVLQELEQPVGLLPARHWTFETALALAKAQANDLDGALDAFRTAARQEPERSEFYYYYGVALLQNGRPELALEQFHTALEHRPRLADAQRYVDLIEGGYRPSPAASTLSFVVILLVLFTVHEYGHAYAAWKLDDDTAARLGRLTLNPLPHLDLFGSILLPGLLLWQNAGVVFGWAKPVPVNPANFRNPQRDHMRVAFAGPAMNFLISMACLLLLGGILLAMRLSWPESLSLNLADPYAEISLVGPPFAHSLVLLIVFLKQLFFTSLVLGVFNLIPIPPLDGSWIFSGLLPRGLRTAFEKIRPYAFLLFLLLVITSAVDYFLIVPVSLAWGALQLLVSAMGFG